MSERWIEIADGVFARRFVELDQTIGLVVGEEGCLVIDTGANEVQGAALAEAITTITRLPWTALITHAHWDHFFGTAAFLPCRVLAHRRCRDTLVADGDEQRKNWVRNYTEAGKPELAERLAAATLVPPTEVFDSRLELDLGGRTVALVHPGRGHTDNDVVVRTGDVVFAGDLVEQGAPPSIGGDAYPLEWPSTMDNVLAMRPSVVVPGHGEPVDTAFVTAQRDELAVIAELVRSVRGGELSVNDAISRSPYPENYTRPALERGQVG